MTDYKNTVHRIMLELAETGSAVWWKTKSYPSKWYGYMVPHRAPPAELYHAIKKAAGTEGVGLRFDIRGHHTNPLEYIIRTKQHIPMCNTMEYVVRLRKFRNISDNTTGVT
jgi:hypothetical protein